MEAQAESGEVRELVLRKSAPAGVLAWTDRAQECAVLRALSGRGLPVPEALALGVDERPFLVMERLPGSPPGRLEPDERAGCSAASSGRGSRGCMPSTRASSASPPTSPAPPPLSPRCTTTGRATRPLGRRRYRCSVPCSPGRSRTSRRTTGAGRALGRSRRPQPPRLRRPISALLDWELTHVGDPLDDLGAAVWSCLGSFEPEDVVAGYEEVVGPRRPQAAHLLPRARLRDPVGDGGQRHRGVDQRRRHLSGKRGPRARAARTRPARAAPGGGLGRPARVGRPPPGLPAAAGSRRDGRGRRALAPRRPRARSRGQTPAPDGETRGSASRDDRESHLTAGGTGSGGRRA